mmetsp:Transcript_24648/g.38323  ORF Transcript_24648/g.38323 Transcript_24648/m.38323 type:complete len:85 (+) Transcript_24648:1785-2039(+)
MAIVENNRQGLKLPQLVIKGGTVGESEKLEDLKGFFTQILEYSRNAMEFDNEQERLFEEEVVQLKKLVQSCKESTDWYVEQYKP